MRIKDVYMCHFLKIADRSKKWEVILKCGIKSVLFSVGVFFITVLLLTIGKMDISDFMATLILMPIGWIFLWYVYFLNKAINEYWKKHDVFE